MNLLRLEMDEDKVDQAKKIVFAQYRTWAKKRGIPFLLDFEEFVKLTSSQCYYCGDFPTMVKEPISKNAEEEEFVHNGIDRVDNELGYTHGNCVSCCSICNKMKQGLFFTGFLDHIKKIYERHKDTIKIIKEGFVV